MSETSAAIPSERQCDSDEGFRTAPWFILRESGLKSNGLSLVLSVIWCAVQGSRIHKTTCKITNEEIAKRAGIRGGAQSALKYLQILDKLGYLRRHGNHQNRIIELTISLPPDGDLRGLTIPEDILSSNLSPTQKLVLSITSPTAFPNMSKSEICRRLRMKKRQLNRVLQSLEPYKKSPSNPIKKALEPYKKLPAIGIEGGDKARVEVVSKDTNRCATHTNDKLINLSGGDEKMDQPEITTSRPSRRKTSSDPYAHLTSSPSKTYSNKPSPEIEDVWKSFPNNAKHKVGNKTYELAKATIRQLCQSPRVGLSNGQVEKLTNRMLKDPRNKFTLKQINDFLDHKFSPEERKEIYGCLSKQHDKIYGGSLGSANLPTALCNINGYSEIMKVWYYPPQPKRAPLVKINPNLDKAVDMVMEVMSDQSYATLNKTRAIIKNLHLIYEGEIRPRMSDEAKYHFGDFRSYVRGFINWATSHYSGYSPVPGWFASRSTPFKLWNEDMKNQMEL
jgi:hypothetical protein